MHELSIALSLLEAVEAAAQREGATSVSRVRLRIGRMSGIASDALHFAWEMARADTVAAAAELHIEVVEVALYCARCRIERSPLAGAGLTCDTCGTIAADVIRGRELELIAMEVAA